MNLVLIQNGRPQFICGRLFFMGHTICPRLDFSCGDKEEVQHGADDDALEDGNAKTLIGQEWA